MADGAPSLRPDVLLAQAGWVRALARALVLDSNRVDDVVQKTWLAALEQPEARVSNVRAWLGGIVRNVVRQEQRGEARRRTREREARVPDPLPGVIELVQRADLQARIVHAVLELEEPFRSTLLWRYFEDLTAEEIARRLGLPASTVRSRLQVALESLRRRFDREGGGDRGAWSLGLIPLMLPRGPARASLTPSVSTGVLSMPLQAFLATSLTLALGFGASYAYRHAREPRATSEPVRTSPSARGAGPGRGSAAPMGLGVQSQRQPLAPRAASTGIVGRVVDLEGAPVAGVLVFVGGQPSPFERVEAGLRLRSGHGEERRATKGEAGEDYHEDEMDPEGFGEWAAAGPERQKKHGALLGRAIPTGPAGEFEVPVPAGARAYVTVYPQLGFRKTHNGAWHAAPAEKIELRVRRVPTAELSIWVTDLTSGKRIAFAGHLFDGERCLAEWEAGEEVVQRRVELEPRAAHRLRAEVDAPSWARMAREFQAISGVDNPIELLVHSGPGLRGEVVDAQGNPLAGAVVVWGEASELRQQRSPFRAYQPHCVVGGVQTDAAGRFTLPGSGARVSAWHPEHSPASVPASAAARLLLPARGAIRGVVKDELGAPVVGTKVVLDRTLEVTTDAQGVYAFDAVEAGLHGLGQPERFFGVVVAPGATLEVPGAQLIRPHAWLTSGGVPFTARDLGGVMLGLEPVFSVSEWEAEGGRLEAGAVRAGRYLVMGRAGILVVLEIPAESATIELGTGRISIEAPEPTDPIVYLLPQELDTNPAARFHARSLFAEGEDGHLEYGPLRPGRYVLIVEGREDTLTLELADGEELGVPRETWTRGLAGR